MSVLQDGLPHRVLVKTRSAETPRMWHDSKAANGVFHLELILSVIIPGLAALIDSLKATGQQSWGTAGAWARGRAELAPTNRRCWIFSRTDGFDAITSIWKTGQKNVLTPHIAGQSWTSGASKLCLNYEQSSGNPSRILTASVHFLWINRQVSFMV